LRAHAQGLNLPAGIKPKCSTSLHKIDLPP
jgi:hypothetical protein